MANSSYQMIRLGRFRARVSASNDNRSYRVTIYRGRRNEWEGVIAPPMHEIVLFGLDVSEKAFEAAAMSAIDQMHTDRESLGYSQI